MSSSNSLSISITTWSSPHDVAFPEGKGSLPYPLAADGRQGRQHFPRPSLPYPFWSFLVQRVREPFGCAVCLVPTSPGSERVLEAVALAAAMVNTFQLPSRTSGRPVSAASPVQLGTVQWTSFFSSGAPFHDDDPGRVFALPSL